MERVKFQRTGAKPAFVELWSSGRLLERLFGRPGTPGRHRSQLFGSAPEAELAWATQVTRLERKGYVVGRHHEALLHAIQAAPDERAPYLVYADWLCEQGDARGELIMRMTNESTFDDLLEAHPTQLAPAWWQRAGISVSWRWGFVQRAVVEPAFDAGALRRLLRHPSLAVVRELQLNRPGYIDWPRALDVRPPTLAHVELNGAKKRLETLAHVGRREDVAREHERIARLRDIVPSVHVD